MGPVCTSGVGGEKSEREKYKKGTLGAQRERETCAEAGNENTLKNGAFVANAVEVLV